MNNILFTALSETSYKFSSCIVDGVAGFIMKNFPEFLSEYIKEVIKTLPVNVPIVYLGYCKLSPEEEYKSQYAPQGDGKVIYDLAPSDMYIVVFKFKYFNDIIEQPLYLPFSRTGNLFRVSGTTYHIVPIISDKVLSPTPKGVFCRLFIDKILFRSDIRNILCNGEKKPVHVVHAPVLKVNEATVTNEIGSSTLTPISLYLTGKYGLRMCFEKYFGIGKDKVLFTDEELTQDVRDNYNVYESTKIRPRSHKEANYVGTPIKICIEKSIPITVYLENFISGLIYSLEPIPNNTRDIVNSYQSENLQDEIFLWRVILGRLAYKGSFTLEKITKDMNNHFGLLNVYLDPYHKEKVNEMTDRYIHDIFDLMSYILEKYTEWSLSSKEHSSEINNKYIDIRYYLLHDIVIGINKFVIKTTARAEKYPNGSPSLQEITKILKTEVSTKSIFKLVKAASMNLATSAVDSSVDTMYHKITSNFDLQERGNGVRRDTGSSAFPETARHLDAYDMATGSILFLSKTAPTPKLKGNLFCVYDPRTGAVQIPDDLKKKIDYINALIKTSDSAVNDVLLNDEDLLDISGIENIENDNETNEEEDESAKESSAKLNITEEAE